MYFAIDSKHNTTPSINLTQQNKNAVRTECQRIYNSYLPLINSSNCVSRRSSAVFKII